jgi:putative FmdB family regulatory protein
MPIYEYECRKCGHAFEALQKLTEGPLRKCPECGELRLRKLVSAPTFRLKGSGWYETDFKKDNRRKIAESGDEKPAAEGGGKDGKKDKAASIKQTDAKAKEPVATSPKTTAAD